MQLNKELAKKMIILYYFTDREMRVGFNITLESHHNNHAISKLIIQPNFLEFGVQVPYINKLMKELSIIYARIINQYIFKYQTEFSARFDKQDEDYETLDETELFFILNINHNSTETDIDDIDFKSPLDHQKQQEEIEISGRQFDKINSMTINFYQTGFLKGKNFVKNRLRSNPILNIEKNDNFCFLWRIIAYLHPCNNNHPNKVSKYKHYFIELNIEGFDFTNGFRCRDVHKFEKLNSLSINLFEVIFYQDQNKWKHKLIPSEVCKNESIRVINSLNYRNDFALIKKVNVFLGDHNKNFKCRQFLTSYTSEYMLMIHKLN